MKHANAQAVESFVNMIQEIMPKGHTLSISEGKKYIKIISSGGGVWGFIQKDNGDVLKAESWSKPARHARGNIHTSEVSEFEWTGPRYLK